LVTIIPPASLHNRIRLCNLCLTLSNVKATRKESSLFILKGTFTRFPRLILLTEILFLVIFESVLIPVLRQSRSICTVVQLSLDVICDTTNIDWKSKIRFFLRFNSRFQLTKDQTVINSENSNNSQTTFSLYSMTSHTILKELDLLQLNIIRNMKIINKPTVSPANF